jgi:hypothetical protein
MTEQSNPVNNPNNNTDNNPDNNTVNDLSNDLEKLLKIKNKGTGAGGSNTNKNGLNYEELTNLCKLLNLDHTKTKFGNGKTHEYHLFKYKTVELYILKKNGLQNYLKNEFNSTYGKSLEPDECLLNKKEKIIIVLEKKFQQSNGSTDEKIQTGDCKRWEYEKLYPGYQIIYIYILSDWFRKDRYKLDIQYLFEKNINVLFGSDPCYLDKLFHIIDTSL